MPEPSPPCQAKPSLSTPEQDPARPVARNSALLTIDLQAAFAEPDSPLFAPGTPEAGPHAIAAAEAFRQAGLPVVHIIRLYDSDKWQPEPIRQNFLAQHPGIMAPGAPGAYTFPGLLPHAAEPDWPFLAQGNIQQLTDKEYLLAKPRWGAFHNTGLQGLLARLLVDSLLLVGTIFPNCVRATIYEALSRDLRVAVIPQATAGYTDERALDLANVGLRIVELNELKSFLNS